MEVLTSEKLNEEPFDTDEIEQFTEAENSSPIAPPVVLIDSSPLNPTVEIEDPVSGSGNPALLGPTRSDEGEQP